MKLTCSIAYKLGLLIAGVLGATFVIVLHIFQQNQGKDLEALMLKQARVLTQQIVLTRKWAAAQGGVYVPKRPGVETNPFLYQVGPGKIRPEMTDVEGTTYTLKNPALITRELSELTSQAGLVRYRLTSLNPINPINAPDPFEKNALLQFNSGAAEVTAVVKDGRRTFFRYMTPLSIEEPCLQCHGFQQYKLGDIRGAISLFLSMDTELSLVHTKHHIVLAGGMVLLVLIMTALFLGSRTLITQPVKLLSSFAARHMGNETPLPAKLLERNDEIGGLSRSLQASSAEIREARLGLERKVEERTNELLRAKEQLDLLSRTDPLTGLFNRRHMQLEAPGLLALSRRQTAATAILLLDIDHFKKLNDTYGHDTGDKALVHIAALLRQSTRPYDLVVRYGGEEFVLILPLLAGEQSAPFAERVRSIIEQTPLRLEEKEIGMTVSIGMYTAAGITDIEAAMRRADEALYQAKNGGRNQVRAAA